MDYLPEFLQNYTLHVQPPSSGLCGPYAIAHFTNQLPNDIVLTFRVMGFKKVNYGTTTRQMSKVLDWMGYSAPEHCILVPEGQKPPQKKCILCIRWINPGTEYHGQGHWVVYDHGYIICSGPNQAGIFKYNDYLSTRKGVNTAYLPIENKFLL